MASKDDHNEYIFVASFYSKKAGRRIYASEYGKKAFKIPINRKPEANK